MNKHLSQKQQEYIKKTITRDLKTYFGNEKIAFGKFRGEEYDNIPLYYLQWLLRNKDNFKVKYDNSQPKGVQLFHHEYMFTD